MSFILVVVKLRPTRWVIWITSRQPILWPEVTTKRHFTLVNLGRKKDGLDEALLIVILELRTVRRAGPVSILPGAGVQFQANLTTSRCRLVRSIECIREQARRQEVYSATTGFETGPNNRSFSAIPIPAPAEPLEFVSRQHSVAGRAKGG